MLNAKTMLTNISKGQSSIPLRYIIKGLEADYNQMRNNIKISYVDINGGKTLVYFKVPSSSIPNFYYDCVFQFDNGGDDKITSNTNFKVYCNSPSFYFRFANIFKRYGALLYPEKYPSFLDIPAEVRNAAQVTGFDKYVYSCLRISTQIPVSQMIERKESESMPRISTFAEKSAEYKRVRGNQESED